MLNGCWASKELNHSEPVGTSAGEGRKLICPGTGVAVGVGVDVGGGTVVVGCAGVDGTIGAGSVVSVAAGGCEVQAELK